LRWTAATGLERPDVHRPRIRSIAHTAWFVCMLSQNCGVVLNARASRTAISGATALRPAMRACTVWRDVPM
jgi:hypothetical protein